MSKEQEILQEIRKVIPNSRKYLFDDCALIEKDLIITSDTIVENIHFDLKNYKPDEIGWKAMAVNLSDIASMGGKPLYSLVSLSLPKKVNLKFIKELYKGIQFCAKKYKTQIIGGNLTSGKEISLTITLIGKVKNPALRNNARSGDLVFCTGNFGSAAAGYSVIASKAKRSHKAPSANKDCFVASAPQNSKSILKFLKSLKTPIPQIEIGQKFVSICKRVCMMDASDGLADCLIQMSDQSNVKITVDENKIPLSNELKSICKSLKKDPLLLSLYGGEDYQLVGTISKNDYKKIKNLKNIKIIGEVRKGKNAFLKQKNNKLVKLSMKKIYAHFK